MIVGNIKPVSFKRMLKASQKCGGYDSTLCLKKVPTFTLFVTLSNLDRFSKCRRKKECRTFLTPSDEKHMYSLI